VLPEIFKYEKYGKLIEMKLAYVLLALTSASVISANSDPKQTVVIKEEVKDDVVPATPTDIPKTVPQSPVQSVSQIPAIESIQRPEVSQDVQDVAQDDVVQDDVVQDDIVQDDVVQDVVQTPQTPSQAPVVQNQKETIQRPNLVDETFQTPDMVQNSGKETVQNPIVMPQNGIQTDDSTEVARNPTDVTQNPTDIKQNPTDVTQNPTDVTQNPTDVTQNPESEEIGPVQRQGSHKDKKPRYLRLTPYEVDIILEARSKGSDLMVAKDCGREIMFERRKGSIMQDIRPDIRPDIRQGPRERLRDERFERFEMFNHDGRDHNERFQRYEHPDVLPERQPLSIENPRRPVPPELSNDYYPRPYAVEERVDSEINEEKPDILPDRQPLNVENPKVPVPKQLRSDFDPKPEAVENRSTLLIPDVTKHSETSTTPLDKTADPTKSVGVKKFPVKPEVKEGRDENAQDNNAKKIIPQFVLFAALFAGLALF
jgi:hypothetical protein